MEKNKKSKANCIAKIRTVCLPLQPVNV